MMIYAPEYDACFITGFQAKTKMPQQLLEMMNGVSQASERELDSSIFKVFEDWEARNPWLSPEEQHSA